MHVTFLPFVVSLLAVCAFAAAPLKSVLVSFPDNTPQKVIDQAKGTIEDAGGFITHEFTLIKGFSAKASEKVLDSVKTMDSKYSAVVEEDEMVNTQRSSS